MKLPEPSWLYLCEALEILTKRGAADDVAQDRLIRAFRHQQIKTQGYYYNRVMPIDPETWMFSQVDWAANSLARVGSQEKTIHVEVHHKDLFEWLRNAPNTDILPAYRSPYLALMLAAESHFGHRLAPSADRAMIKEIIHWLREHWGEFVEGRLSENRITQMAGLIRHPDLGKGGNQRLK